MGGFSDSASQSCRNPQMLIEEDPSTFQSELKRCIGAKGLTGSASGSFRDYFGTCRLEMLTVAGGINPSFYGSGSV